MINIGKKYVVFFLMTMLLFTACGNDDADNSSSNNKSATTGQKYYQKVSIEAQGEQKTVVINSLHQKIENINGENSWVSVLIKPYSSGSPSVVLDVAANGTNADRTCDIIMNDISGNIVILTVTQNYIVSTIEDSHDMKTDEPAFSRSVHE